MIILRYDNVIIKTHLPMTNGSTSILSTSSNQQSMKSPRRATIELIRQFARTCISIKEVNFDVMMAN